MSEHRIGELHLDVRSAGGNRERLRSMAEDFARRVLAACGDELESRFPGRMILLRGLPVHWELTSEQFSDSRLVADFSSQLAETVAARVERGAGAPSAQKDLAVFAGEAEWRASFLAARVKRNGWRDWYFDSLRAEGGSLIQFLERAGIEAVLERLDELDALQQVLAAASPLELSSLRGRLKIEAPAGGGPHAGDGSGDAPPRVSEILAETARRLASELSGEAIAVLLYVKAKRLLGPSAGRDRVRSAVSAAMAARGEHPGERPTPADEPTPAKIHRVQPSEPSGELSPELVTNYGGFFYLVSLALELGLPELLWKACLPEGLVLARVLTELLPARDAQDPAPAAAGGVANPRAPFEASSEQQRAVATELSASLAAALTRRGLASLPETVLFVEEGETGKRLAAAPAGFEALLFAWPFEDRESLLSGLESFLDGWPPSAPPVRASPALAAMDVRGRLRADKEPAPERPSSRFTGEGLAKAALLAQSAGSLLYLFAARAGCERSGIEDIVSGRLRAAARIARRGEALEVRMAARAIRPELRSAGLDRNPGWAAWLGKKIELRFDGADEELRPQA